MAYMASGSFASAFHRHGNDFVGPYIIHISWRLGPNIDSLLSLIGLDCIFNLGTTLFLLMADSCARPKKST
ncbi:hypothetical protein Dsin_026377 [Dipteronia sinensis]|uniref:Uncharacterized protein n=1 Tax=Dipteronia sinensis TaxID=43782 RepID=A0AAD9ZXI1_9ROSI|nr:hypothetical protein Dsin_026377 [Dipteronia sinensis]